MRFFVIKIPKWLGAIINFFIGLFKPKSKKIVKNKKLTRI